jgi:D-glucuronyl C5-epimerase-like protein
MHKALAALSILIVLTATAGSAQAADRTNGGLVYRYYAPYGYRFQPLLSFGNLNRAVSDRNPAAARQLAAALLARGVRRGGALYWEYDFSFGGGPSRWTSGFTQAVAAQALARAGVLLRDPSLESAADAAFRALSHGLLLQVHGGLWIREYGYTQQVILNAQLQSVLALESYASIAQTPESQRVARSLEHASRTLLPQFDLGCWGRYQLGGTAADAHYEAYHVELLRRLAASHDEPIWADTYRRWSRCLR